MRDLACAVCHSVSYRVRYPERLPPTGEMDFAARRTPLRHHHRIVECTSCGLVYSNPYFDDGVLRPLYREAGYIDESQLEHMAADYLRVFMDSTNGLESSATILEIGCANGFFLEKLRESGFTDVTGVEPGKEAVAKASGDIRERIVNDFFRPHMFAAESFDVVCCFQIFDHLPDPNGFLRDIATVLRPEGRVIAINHNIRALITKVLGERSPMYDIEHICLFDRHTIRRLFEANGFDVIRVSGLSNGYAPAYAAKMFPLPSDLKRTLVSFLAQLPGSVRLRLPAGNMVTVGRKGRETR
jgi:SAM-dependent methyltransferase